MRHFFQGVHPDAQLALTLPDPSGRLIHAFRGRGSKLEFRPVIFDLSPVSPLLCPTTAILDSSEAGEVKGHVLTYNILGSVAQQLTTTICWGG